jgi:uncharacterized membrane protein YjjP (DUF1212 family)
MENIVFSKSDRITWIFIFAGLLVMTVRVLYKIEHWGYPEMLLMLGLIIHTFLFVYIISDILKKKNKYRFTLILLMFILPAIAPIAYMIKYKYSSK